MPRYDYECNDCQHTFEAFNVIDERSTQKCAKCGGQARVIITEAPSTVCYGQDECSTKHGPEGVTFTGPRDRARWLKAHHKEDVGKDDLGAVWRRRNEAKAERKKARRKASKQNAVNIAKVCGATGDDIVRTIDGDPKWADL